MLCWEQPTNQKLVRILGCEDGVYRLGHEVYITDAGNQVAQQLLRPLDDL